MENVSIGLLNRVLITNLTLDDQQGKELLQVKRLSAKFDLLPLLRGKFSISNVQLFGFQANLKRKTPESPTNFQFITDAFASKDSVKKENRLDLRINSLLIRRGRISYDVASQPETPGRFNNNHFFIKDIVATISLKALSNDSINLQVKRMSLEEEHSGFSLKKLRLKVVGNDEELKMEHFMVELPRTSLVLDTLQMRYDSLGAFNRFAHEVHFQFRMLPSQFTLGDLSSFIPSFKGFNEPISIEAEAEGPLNQLHCPLLRINAKDHVVLQGGLSLQDFSTPKDAYLYGRLSRLYADPQGVDFLVRNLNPLNPEVPPLLKHLGTISFNGEVSGYFNDLVMYGRVRTDVGEMKTDLKLSSDKEQGLFT